MSPIIRTSLIFLIGATLADACQVPVFRYALERWRNDPYQVFVVANGELEAGARKTFEQLRALEEDFKAPANIYAKKIDLAKEPADSPLRKHVKDGKIELPAILLYYPEERLKYPPIWTAPATQDRVKVLANSPVRREVLQRILKGDSAVWVMVESGNTKVDDSAYAQVKKHLGTAVKELKLPEGVLDAKKARDAIEQGKFFDQSNVLQSEIPLKLAFSQVRVSRKDPAEQAFLQMLLNTESDLDEFKDQPMFFPVFGRGRALEAIIGKGVNEDNVWEYCAYITGACSCEVKKQNPGVDLLTSMDWDAVIEGSEIIIEKALPPLEGVASLLDGPEKSKPVSEKEPTPPKSKTISKTSGKDALIGDWERKDGMIWKFMKDGKGSTGSDGVFVDFKWEMAELGKLTMKYEDVDPASTSYEVSGDTLTLKYPQAEVVFKRLVRKPSKKYPAEFAYTWEPGDFATIKQTLTLGKTGELTISPSRGKPIKGTWEVSVDKHIILTYIDPASSEEKVLQYEYMFGEQELESLLGKPIEKHTMLYLQGVGKNKDSTEYMRVTWSRDKSAKPEPENIEEPAVEHPKSVANTSELDALGHGSLSKSEKAQESLANSHSKAAKAPSPKQLARNISIVLASLLGFVLVGSLFLRKSG